MGVILFRIAAPEAFRVKTVAPILFRTSETIAPGVNFAMFMMFMVLKLKQL
jgi:hypothetical protein